VGLGCPPFTQDTKIVGSCGLDSILLTQGSRVDQEVISLITVWGAIVIESREGRGDRLRGVVACCRIYEFDKR